MKYNSKNTYWRGSKILKKLKEGGGAFVYYRTYHTIELNSGEMVVLPEGIAIRDYLWAALIRATWLRKCEKRQEISLDEAEHIKWFPRPNTYAFYYGSFLKASKKAFQHCRLHSYFDMTLTGVMEIVTPRKKVVEDVPQEYIDKLRRESQKQRRRKSSSPWGAEKRRRKEMAKGHSGGRPKTNPEMVAKAIDDFLIANNGRIPSPADCGRDKAIGYSYKVACDIMGKTREARREYGKKRMKVLKPGSDGGAGDPAASALGSKLAELDNSTTETLGGGSVSVGPMIEEVPAKSEVAEGEPGATEEGSVKVEEVSDESGAGGSGATEEELEAAEAEDEEPGAAEETEEVSELEDEEQEPGATEEGSVKVEEVSDESGAGGSGATEEELEAAEAEDEEPGAAEETEDLDRTDDEAEAESEEPDTTGPEPDVTGDEGDGGEEHTPMSDLVYVEESRSGKNGLKITIHIEDGGIQQLRGAELKFSIAFPK